MKQFWKFLSGLVLTLVFLAGCSGGRTKLNEQYYIGATNGIDRVYYRVTIMGDTILGVTEFRQGWFPESAVDALFGDVSESGAGKTILRDELKLQLDEALTKANKNYLEKVISDNPTDKELEKALAAVNRVRQTADENAGLLDEAVVMEYNPLQGLFVKHSDEKLVMVLSSNPDDIMSKLAQLSNDQETKTTLTKFTGVLSILQRQKDQEEKEDELRQDAEIEALLTQAESDDAVIAQQLTASLTAIDGSNGNRGIILAQLEALISLLKSSDNQKGGTP